MNCPKNKNFDVCDDPVLKWDTKEVLPGKKYVCRILIEKPKFNATYEFFPGKFYLKYAYITDKKSVLLQVERAVNPAFFP